MDNAPQNNLIIDCEHLYTKLHGLTSQETLILIKCLAFPVVYYGDNVSSMGIEIRSQDPPPPQKKSFLEQKQHDAGLLFTSEGGGDVFLQTIG
jgi:hypothetical protein